MIIKLLPEQVPLFWDAIKFAAVQADEIDNKDLQPYLNELLHSLLGEKAQCFAGLDDKRTLVGILITRLGIDKITGDKYLLVQAVYTWKMLSDQVWKDAYELFQLFAKKEECKYITFNSRNPAIWNKAEKLGFVEKTRTYSLKID
jgi:hypothetical protein